MARTTQAPVSGVQKITGLSLALKVLDPAVRADQAGRPSMVGKPRSLSAGPPSAWYRFRTRRRSGARRWRGEEDPVSDEVLAVPAADLVDVAVLVAHHRVRTARGLPGSGSIAAPASVSGDATAAG